MSVYSQFKLE